ncbi:MAG: efflux RND transporter periplasmic adaptor subunit [Akkermansiaceae bacterium]|nr:efflux RND transporter periplasmic adaptor subunit [Akkermansiaceae bacterium]
MAKLLRIIIPLLILAVGYFGFGILAEKEELEVRTRPAPKIIETEVQVMERRDFRVTLSTQGIVRPHNETALTPRVSGRVIKISPKFESGSFFEKGDILLELDPSDFLAALSAAEARLARSEAAFAQEDARAKQALLDWEDLGYTEPPTELVLRKPQLKEAEANVKASEAELLSAQNDLKRAQVLAPYDGRVRERSVGLGQSVSPGTTIGEIFSTNFAEVRLSLSTRDLVHVDLPDNPDDLAVPVTLTDALATENPTTWRGMIVRTEGSLDEKSRKLFVIARVDDPFALKKENAATPPLRIGQPIRAEIKGNTIENVFIVPRDTLLRPNEIVLIEPVELTIARTRIEPVWSDSVNLIVRDNITEGWLLSTSRLPSAPQGAPVVILEPEEEGNEGTEAAALPKDSPGA